MLSERIAPALLGLSGVLTLLSSMRPGAAVASGALVLHWQFMMVLLGLGLLAAVAVPGLRLAVMAGAALSQTALLGLSLAEPVVDLVPLDMAGLVLVMAAGVLFWRAAQQQARWEGTGKGMYAGIAGRR